MTTQTNRIEPPGQTLTGAQARAEMLEAMPVAERQLTVAGIDTAVLEGGDGPPIVLLHGPGEHAPKWVRVAPQLAATFRVVAPDLPGHGASQPMDDPTVDRALEWLGELIDETCKTPPALVGQILGGAIAARFAAKHGDRISHLVLADALGLADFDPAPEFGGALQGFLQQPSGENHDKLWEQCSYDLDRLRDQMGPMWSALRTYNLDRAGTAELAPTQHALMQQFGFPAIPEAELAGISVPTALIWGRGDLATRLTVAEAAAERHGWPLHVIDGAADDPAIDQPEAFVRTLRAVLAGER